jgi:7-keto-8-aminopelargonate synthetase-like enzyme
VIYSDQYNHASIIDGVRLCRAVAKQTASKLYRNRDVGAPDGNCSKKTAKKTIASKSSPPTASFRWKAT